MSMLMRRFDRVKTSNNRTAYRVECKSCDRHTDVVAAHQDFPPEIVAKKARQRGWDVDKKGNATCPVCNEAARMKHTKEKAMKPDPVHVEVPNVTPIPPRDPTQTDLRRIMREIDDHWDESHARYTGSTTDQTIADKLNVPRAWVATERARAFGDQMRNEMAEQAVEQLKQLKRDIDKAVQRALDAAAALDTQKGHVTALIAKYEKLLA